MPLEAIELPEPRLEPPEPFAGLFRADRYDRVSHALGKAYRDVVRGFRGEFEHPPDLVAYPRVARGRRRSCSTWCADAEGGGDPVRRRHQRRRRRRAADGRRAYRGVVTIDLRRLDRVLEVDAVSRAARIQAGATGPGPRGPAPRARPHAAPLPAVVRVLDPRRLDRHPRRRPLRDALHAHRRPRRVGARDHPSRRSGRAGGCRAPAPGPSPDRMLIGSEGILGVITEAWVRVQRAARSRRSPAAVAFDDFARGGRGRPRDLARPALYPSNCRLLDAVEAETTGAGPPGKALLVLGFESAHHPVDAPMALALDAARDHGGEPGEVRAAAPSAGAEARREAPAPSAPAATRSAPGATPSSRALPARHAGRLRRALRHLRDRDHLGPLRGLPRRGDGDGAGARRRGLRRAGRGPRLAADQLPLHPRLSGRPGALLHGARARPARRRGRAVGRDQGGGLGSA